MKKNRTKAKSPENRERNKNKKVARKAKRAKERVALLLACGEAHENAVIQRRRAASDRRDEFKRMKTQELLSPIATGEVIAGRKVYSLI